VIPNALSANLITVVTADGEEFESPGVQDFWWPLIGGDSHWTFTRPSLVMLLSVVLIAVFFIAVTRNMSVVPSKVQFAAEGVYNFTRNTIGRDVIGSKEFKPFVPLLFTIFTLIAVNNIAGVVPFVQFPTMSRLGFPVVLTLIVYVVYHAVALKRKHGVIGYMKSLVPPGLPVWLIPLMFVLELLTYFVIRPVTLALRLFGNMLAGHLMLLLFILGGEYLLLHGDSLLLNVSGVFSLLFSIVMTFFELLIQFLQAFIFTILAALYISDAVAEEH